MHLSTGMNTLPMSGARFPFWYLTMPSFARINFAFFFTLSRLYGIKMLANLPVTIVLVPKMCTSCLGLLHHQLGVVVVQLPTSKQLLQGSNNLQR